jgi:hypothetical protein
VAGAAEVVDGGRSPAGKSRIPNSKSQGAERRLGIFFGWAEHL